MEKLSVKQFNTKLSGVVKSLTTQRENIQQLIEAGLVEVQESGNTIFLTRTLDACVNVKALPTKAIKEYIKAHCTNLAWRKDKAGNLVFMKEKKGVAYKITEPTVKWYNHESNGKSQAKEDMDVMKQAELFIKRINKGLKEHKVKDEKVAKELVDNLTATWKHLAEETTANTQKASA